MYNYKGFDFCYEIENINLNVVIKNITDLEVIFENNLKFNMHVTEKVLKTNSILGLLRETLGSCRQQIFLLLYKPLVSICLDAI